MGLVTFGQPDEWVRHLKVGPWFLLESFTGIDAQYRGRPADSSLSLAISFAGHMMIELLQEHRPVPSVYRETIETRDYGFHHWGIASKDFDADLARYQSSGYEVAFHARVPTGGRVAYIDTTRDLPGMVELIELGADFDEVFRRFHRASTDWDGRDPVRPFL